MGKCSIVRYFETVEDAAPMTLQEHDAIYHKPKFDPRTMTCELRERRAKLDPVDGEVTEGGISGIFTGSVADYNRPSLSNTGSGIGESDFGHGLYGTNSRDLANTYADSLSFRNGKNGTYSKLYVDGERVQAGLSDPERIAAAFATSAVTVDDVKKRIEERISQVGNDDSELRNRLSAAIDYIDKNKNRISIGNGNGIVYEQTYFTNRSRGDESHLLNSEMPIGRNLFDAINLEAKKEGIDLSSLGVSENTNGGDVYEEIKKILGSKQATSEFFVSADVDGLKYPASFDAYSRKVNGLGSKWNYVSFRDDNIRVDRKWVDGHVVEAKDAATGKIENYLRAVAEDAEVPKNETLEEHRKHCDAKPGNCPFEKKLDRTDKVVSAEPKHQDSGVSEAEDAAYLDAVKRVDMETCAKMVREAAAKAMSNTKVVDKDGLPLAVYHGTPRGGFNIFKIVADKDAPEDAGVYFSTSSGVSSLYGGSEYYHPGRPPVDELLRDYINEGTESSLLQGWSLAHNGHKRFIKKVVRSEEAKRKFHLEDGYGLAYEDGTGTGTFFSKTKEEVLIKLKDSLIETCKESAKSPPKQKRPLIYKCFLNITNPIEINAKGSEDALVERPDYFDATKRGFDGFIIYNVIEYGTRRPAHDCVVYNPSNIKSADPVTYDDAKNIIPLSKRFDMNNPDIRY